MSYRNEEQNGWSPLIVIVACVLVVIFIVFAMWAWPQYNVYSQRLSGEAILAKAESTRQARVIEAKAKQDAAESEAKAEVIRAEGTAKAAKIMGDALNHNHSYVQWQWLRVLEETGTHGSLVYVPTEAGVPTFLLESGRGAQRAQVGLPVKPVSDASEEVEEK